ncbi:hypothetical protein BV20DRAFT_88165 [Pilatotrama ljubarskyi]|nr:hypothetical protein BV20DRAFT_88165 [Pilatotrama ljubarskyi]
MHVLREAPDESRRDSSVDGSELGAADAQRSPALLYTRATKTDIDRTIWNEGAFVGVGLGGITAIIMVIAVCRQWIPLNILRRGVARPRGWLGSNGTLKRSGRLREVSPDVTESQPDHQQAPTVILPPTFGMSLGAFDTGEDIVPGPADRPTGYPIAHADFSSSLAPPLDMDPLVPNGPGSVHPQRSLEVAITAHSSIHPAAGSTANIPISLVSLSNDRYYSVSARASVGSMAASTSNGTDDGYLTDRTASTLPPSYRRHLSFPDLRNHPLPHAVASCHFGDDHQPVTPPPSAFIPQKQRRGRRSVVGACVGRSQAADNGRRHRDGRSRQPRKSVDGGVRLAGGSSAMPRDSQVGDEARNEGDANSLMTLPSYHTECS